MNHWERRYFGTIHKGNLIFFLNSDAASKYERNNDAAVYGLEPRASIKMLFDKEYETLKKIIRE